LPIGRYLGALAGIFVILYALVFFTGDSPTPKLGLDLEGGTQVTLQAQTTDNKPPSSAALDQARQIIERRVNGLGVAEAEVVTQSPDRIVISVPGANGDAAKSVGQTAQLRLRPVIYSAAAAATPPAATPSAGTSGSPKPTASASAKPSASPSRPGRPLRRASRRLRRRPLRRRPLRPPPLRPPPARPRPRRPASIRSSTRRPSRSSTS
jgi:preprotein translocase subunit SecD